MPSSHLCSGKPAGWDGLVAVIGRAGINPLDEISDRFVRQPEFLGGHGRAPLGPEALKRRALAALPGDNGRSAVASAKHRRPRIEPQPALRFGRLARMTAIALGLEDRLDLLAEELSAIRLGRL